MNDNQLITKESEWIAYFTSSIERIIAKMGTDERIAVPLWAARIFLRTRKWLNG